MNIPSNLLTALLTGALLLMGTLVNGYWIFRSSSQKNRNEFSISAADSLRKDNEQLAKRLTEARAETVELAQQLKAAQDAERAHQKALRLAEDERDGLRAACEIFRSLYEECIGGKPVSADRMARITTRLLDAGYVFRS